MSISNANPVHNDKLRLSATSLNSRNFSVNFVFIRFGIIFSPDWIQTISGKAKRNKTLPKMV